MAAAAGANPSVELAVIDSPSVSSSAAAIAAVGVFFKFLGWTLLYLATAAVVVAAIVAVYFWVSRELSRRRRRREAEAERRLRVQLQRQMMSTVRHAPYQRLLAARVVRNPCVVCRTEFEAGEACSVLPACVHVFHTECIARWLRYHTTCPVCNVTVALQGEELNDV